MKNQSAEPTPIHWAPNYKSESANHDTNNSLRQQISRLRGERAMTLRDLAERSGVSRAMISRIERGEVNPSAVIVGKLAEALEVSISTLIGGAIGCVTRHMKPSAQPVFTDQESGIVRRSLSPIFPNHGVDVVLNTLPPGGTSGSLPAHRLRVTEVIYVLEGSLRFTVGEAIYVLDKGDSFFFEAHESHRFDNLGNADTVFISVIDGSGLRV